MRIKIKKIVFILFMFTNFFTYARESLLSESSITKNSNIEKSTADKIEIEKLSIEETDIKEDTEVEAREIEELQKAELEEINKKNLEVQASQIEIENTEVLKELEKVEIQDKKIQEAKIKEKTIEEVIQESEIVNTKEEAEIGNVEVLAAEQEKVNIEEMENPKVEKLKVDIETEILNIKTVYEELNISDKIDYDLFKKAYIGYLQVPGKTEGILTIIDYRKPSSEERFFVINLNEKRLVFSERVAHAKNSGLDIPYVFSNTPNSYTSSLGFYLTLDEYDGKYGNSLRLRGLEKNINSSAEKRAIVIHGEKSSEEKYLKEHGFLGRSWGCPVLPLSKTKEIVNYIKGNRVLFIYGYDENYLKDSEYILK